MLLAVLGLFLSTEVPQGLLGLASALAPDFFKSCYSMFGNYIINPLTATDVYIRQI
jgi:hypothetical protein